MQYLINKMQDFRITMGKRTICYYWSMGVSVKSYFIIECTVTVESLVRYGGSMDKNLERDRALGRAIVPRNYLVWLLLLSYHDHIQAF